MQVAIHVCLYCVLRTDKRAPTEGAARDAKVGRRGSKAQQEEGGDAPEKDRRRGPEEKKVEEQLPSMSICNKRLPMIYGCIITYNPMYYICVILN